MKARVCRNRIKDAGLSRECLEYVSKAYLGREKIELSLNELYTVYGLMFSHHAIWLCIINNEEIQYPSWYPANFFEIIDNTIPTNWIFSQNFDVINSQLCVEYMYIFEPWSSTPAFYDELDNENPDAIQKFLTEKKKIDEES